MNQDQLKEELLKLQSTVEDFSLVFTGKESTKVDGLYDQKKKEIILHNKNLESDNSLIYAAIHEFAHHIQYTTSPIPVSARSHNAVYRNIFHNLLKSAEKKDVYSSIFKKSDEFASLTNTIKEKYLSVNGELMLEFGKALLDAQKLCIKYNVDFDTYVDIELNLNRLTAKTILNPTFMSVNPKIGFDNMKIVSGIKDIEKAKEAEKAFIDGETPDMVRAKFSEKEVPDSRLTFLMEEKGRIELTIERLNQKLTKVDEFIEEIKQTKDTNADSEE